jgi:holin-like protein
MDMLRGLAVLLLCQSAGEVLARLTGLPLPGPVLGLLLLWGALSLPMLGPWLRTPVAAVAEPLLSHLSLLFVPVGVGVVAHLGLVGEFGGRMLAAVVLSTWIGMAVAALALRAGLPGLPGLSSAAAGPAGPDTASPTDSAR